MTCHDVQQDLALYVLGDLPPTRAAAIRAHVAACSRCREAEEDLRLVVCEIKLSADGGGVRGGFERAVRSAGAAAIGAARSTSAAAPLQRTGRRVVVRRVVAATGSMAALLVLGVGLWGLWRSAGRGGALPRAPGAPADRWRYSGVHAAPASVADGVVVRGASMYLLCNDSFGSNVAAIDAETGSQRWHSDVNSLGYLAADEARVYCLAAGPRGAIDLVALRAGDGEELWRYTQHAPGRLQALGRLQAPCRPIPLGADRLCWTNNRTVHVLDGKTGRAVWTRPIPRSGALSAAVPGGENLYVASGRALHCLHAGSGRVVWTQELPQELRGRRRPLLALADGRVYFVQSQAGTGARLFCMGLGSRRLIWQRAIPRPRCLLAAGRGIYVRAKRILALDRATGQPLWACTAGGCGPLTRSGGLIHFVDSSDQGRLIALDQRTGRKAWEIAGIRSCDAFRRVGTTGYIKTQDGTVRAIALAGLTRF